MINLQKAEAPVVGGWRSKLDVVEIFPTVQGEGPFAGRRAVFIRFAGCNLVCPGCDTNYTRGREQLTVGEILDDVAMHLEKEFCFDPFTQSMVQLTGSQVSLMPIVVLTGGEPFRQELDYLITVLLSFGLVVQVETNGTLPISDLLVRFVNKANLFLVCSPKDSAVHESIEDCCTDYKFIIPDNPFDIDPDDGLPLKALDRNLGKENKLFRPDPSNEANIYVQPADYGVLGRNKDSLDNAVASVKKHGYRLCVQMHKIAGIP